MPVQKCHLAGFDASKEESGERYWKALNSPVLDENNKLLFIIHMLEDVTEIVQLKENESTHTRVQEELILRAERNEKEIFRRAQEIQEYARELEKLNRKLAIARDEAVTSTNAKIGILSQYEP